MDCDRCRDRAVPPTDLFEAHEDIVRAAYDLVHELRIDGDAWGRNQSSALTELVRVVLADINRTGRR
jgi:hypothetical protein